MDLYVTALALVVFLAVLLSTGNGHLCVIEPRQRGDFDISKSGSHTCFRHGPPCGGEPASPPTHTYLSSTAVTLLWQQNYNHYTVGYPGYMDVAWSDVTDMKNFHLLAVIGDLNEHAQDHQRNYSIPVVMPSVHCSHCVLRFRYNSHKPGEQIFYQCADIAIKNLTVKTASQQLNNLPVKSPTIPQPPPNPTTMPGSTRLYGFSYSELDTLQCELVSVDAVTGAVYPVKTFDFGVGSGYRPEMLGFGKNSNMSRRSVGQRQNFKAQTQAQGNHFIMDQMLGYSEESKLMFTMKHGKSSSLDAVADTLLVIEAATGNAMEKAVDPKALMSPIVAMTTNGLGSMLTFNMDMVRDKPGTFTFRVGLLDQDGSYQELYSDPSKTEDLYINYLCATADTQKNVLYVLMGNENAPDTLDARIYTFDLSVKPAKMSYAQLDVDNYTISSIHFYQKTGKLVAVSPGLFLDRQVTYTLVTVDPKLGLIKPLWVIAVPDRYQSYYGGDVINLDQQNGVLYHVLRLVDPPNADVIATVSMETQRVTFSNPTNLRHLHNLSFLPYISN
uniref:Uncharacterized protein n=2 Tax=Branchiostoma floridae TaxID=7739 RepID=C3Z250_BRAFL|eukprot:XP_002597089.1 hypothetical protein BRAFLDRAFT_105037 [Branchiostoma floridae]